jgi:hypothetical protein
MTEELKPAAWIVIECGCRAPDDCEDYEVLVSAEDIGNYQKHIDHGRAYPLYGRPIALDQAKQVLAEAGMVAVPAQSRAHTKDEQGPIFGPEFKGYPDLIVPDNLPGSRNYKEKPDA